ncbi:MAG: hypothetical protein KIS86_06870 [Devosia sp.]|nr:hypothetical protein [Devosia sp.]
MPVSSVTRASAVSHLSILAATPPRSIAERMADVFVANDEAERVTLRPDLHREGFTDAEIDAHQVEAVAIAGKRLAKSRTRDVNAARTKSHDEITRDMADIIGSLLPPTQIVIAELQARGISRQHIDLLLPKSRAIAALAFCEGQTGWAN